MDMQDQPRYEAYEPADAQFAERGAASRTLVEGTIARGHLREDTYFYTGKMDGARGATGTSAATPNTGAGPAGAQSAQTTGDTNVRGNVAGGVPGASGAGGADIFPFPLTEDVLKRGRGRYEAFCAMCHGLTGEGDGMIVRRGFQRPPSYFEDRLQEGASSASHFFDVITNGWGAMPAYDYMIPPQDRWAIIAYVRALQLSRRMRLDELPPAEREKVLSGAQQQPPAHGSAPAGTQTQQRPQGGPGH